MVGVALGPLGGRVIDKLVPWYAALFSSVMLAIFQSIQTGAGGVNVAAVIITTVGLDIFRQTVQVSLAIAVFEYVSSRKFVHRWSDLVTSIDPSARSRLNSVMLLSVCDVVKWLTFPEDILRAVFHWSSDWVVSRHESLCKIWLACRSRP